MPPFFTPARYPDFILASDPQAGWPETWSDFPFAVGGSVPIFSAKTDRGTQPFREKMTGTQPPIGIGPPGLRAAVGMKTGIS
jgi:hypothetical protein